MKEQNNMNSPSDLSKGEDQKRASTSHSTGESRGQAARAIIKDEEIDLIALVKTIWDGRRTIYYSVGVCVFIGLLIAFLSPAKYTASATLLPSSQDKSSSMSGLSSLAGMAGINLSSMMGQSEGIPADLYPAVVNSYPFLNEFIHEKFHFQKYKEPVSIYDYVTADSVPSLGEKLVKYTIRLPWTIKDAVFSGKKEDELQEVDFGVLNLSMEDQMTLGAMFELFQIDVDNKTGLVSISVEVEEPVLAAQYVQKAVDLLQEYIIDYKTQQARENLDFVQGRFDEKKAEYEETQRVYFNYKDSHRNTVSERVDMEFQRLSDAYDMASTVYNSLAQQLEQAKISVKEETPVFTVLEPAKVPFKKSSPDKKIILVLSVFLGGFIGLAVIFGKLIWRNLLNILK